MIANVSEREKQIVAAARSYLGVPFAHQGRSRNGLDCLGLLVAVARDCQLTHDGKPVSAYDDLHYGHFPDVPTLQAGLAQVLQQCNTLRAGCVALLKVDGEARHLAILADYGDSDLAMIHAYAPARKVVEHRMDKAWQERIAGVYSYASQDDDIKM